MTRLSRRQFLATSAAVAATGIEGIVAARRAPAYAQGTRLHLLQWSHFVPAADVLFESPGQGVRQAGRRRGRDRADQPERSADARDRGDPERGGTGHHHPRQQPRAPLRVVAGRRQRRGRGDRRASRAAGTSTPRSTACAGGRWIGVPQFIISWAITYREDWLKEAGFEYPKTWDDFRKVGRAHEGQGQALRPGLRSQHQRPQQLVLPDAVDVGRRRRSPPTAARWC